MKMYKNNYWTVNYKTFIADIHIFFSTISATEKNNTFGKITAAVKMLLQHEIEISFFF